MNQKTKKAFISLNKKLYKSIANKCKDILNWRECLKEVPFCYVNEVSGEEMMMGVLIKGSINLWESYALINDPDDDSDDDPDDKAEESSLIEPDDRIKKQMTARFYFKEKNQAVLVYPPQEDLPQFVGTWQEIFLEIIDFVRRKSCEDVAQLNMAEQVRLFGDPSEN